MINDPKEREHYTLKCCCANCKHKLRESPIFPFTLPFCEIKRKNLGGDLNYNHNCKSFVAVMTPEENKEWYLRFKKNFEKTEANGNN